MIVVSRHLKRNKDHLFFISAIVSISLSLLSISHTLHHGGIFCNKCTPGSLELQSWRSRQWGPASDPRSAPREAWLNIRHLQKLYSAWDSVLKWPLIQHLHFSDVFRTDRYHTAALSLCLSLSPSLCLLSLLSLSRRVSSLGSILLTLSPRSLIDILGEALQREGERKKERERNESHTL